MLRPKIVKDIICKKFKTSKPIAGAILEYSGLTTDIARSKSCVKNNN